MILGIGNAVNWDRGSSGTRQFEISGKVVVETA